MITDLTDGIFTADSAIKVNRYRRNLQSEYVRRLIAIAGLEGSSGHDTQSQAMALYELDRISKGLSSSVKDQSTQVHRFYLKDRINRAFHKSKS
jgi:hypothetical protein